MRYCDYLKQQNLSKSTIHAYTRTVETFYEKYKVLNKDTLLEWRSSLIENYAPRTVNARIISMNKFLMFLDKEELKLKTIKIQEKTFTNNIITLPDYQYLKNKLKEEGKDKIYFMVWFLGATGARVSELVKFKVEHVQVGYLDIYSKGGKLRRIYIPEKLQKECLEWLERESVNSGYLFLNKFGNQISTRGVRALIKKYGEKYGMESSICYPHSFRHMYAKNFLAKYNDLALLADLLGHESMDTTRIYLRKTAAEQQNLINTVVDW